MWFSGVGVHRVYMISYDMINHNHVPQEVDDYDIKLDHKDLCCHEKFSKISYAISSILMKQHMIFWKIFS